MPSPKRAPVAVLPPTPALVRVRTDGLHLIQPLQRAVQALVVTTPEQYLEADAVLSRVRQARALWKSKVDPIRDPIKKAKAELDASLKGVKELDEAVDGPLATLEATVKDSMRTFKYEEARQLAAAKEEQDREAARLRAEAERKAQQEIAARTPQLKAKLAQARAELESQAQAVESGFNGEEAPQGPTRGVSSTSRTIEKCRISNLTAFVRALQDYEPVGGLYKKGVPPLSLIPMEALQTALNKVFREQPGIVASWAGVELWDDITIAGR